MPLCLLTLLSHMACGTTTLLYEGGNGMNIFKHLFHSRDKPKNALNGSGYNFYFGGSSSGKCVNERTSLQITAVYTCIRVIAEAIAGLPLHLYKLKYGFC